MSILDLDAGHVAIVSEELLREAEERGRSSPAKLAVLAFSA
jgi:hypothetical protein